MFLLTFAAGALLIALCAIKSLGSKASAEPPEQSPRDFFYRGVERRARKRYEPIF